MKSLRLTKLQWVSMLCFFSVALNVTLAAMLVGQQHGRGFSAVQRAMERMSHLPPEERSLAQKTLRKHLPELRQAMRQLRATRQETMQYIASDAYQRDEAEQRFQHIREQTTTLQIMAQQLMLEVADSLPPQHRAQLLKQPATSWE